jgi:hypothetical protein
VIKESLIGAYLKSGGTLRKRDARDLVKIDVNKSGRIWDFFQQSGWFTTPDQPATSMEVDGVGLDPNVEQVFILFRARDIISHHHSYRPSQQSLASSSATLLGTSDGGAHSQSVPPMMNGIHEVPLPHTSASAAPDL